MTIERILLLSPAAPGSKGDEGMMRGALALMPNVSVTVLNPETDSAWKEVLDDALAPGQSLTEVKGAFRDFAPALREGDLMLVVGADVIDGTCGIDPALARLDLMAEALRRGLPVLASCSFRARVDQTILRSLRLLSDVRFLIRDLHSLDNFERQTGLRAAFFPDLSFFAGPGASALTEEARQVIAKARQNHGRVIGVNFAEHSFRSFHDQHDAAHRIEFVGAVMAELEAACPGAFFVVFSNDTRTWDNHPSDSAYGEIASAWIEARRGAGHHMIVPDKIGYSGNIALLAEVDFVISGRMHLCLAAFQSRTPPFVLMGEGKGYSSVDKMRGAFAKTMGSTSAVVTEIAALGAALETVLGDRAAVDQGLLAAAEERARDCTAGRVQIENLLALESAGSDELAVARAEAYLLLRDQAEELQLQRAETAKLPELELRLKEEQERIEELRKAADAKIAYLERAATILTRGGDTLAHELHWTAKRPWLPVKRALQRVVLKVVLLFQETMSDTMGAKLRRSLAKRKPRRHLLGWEGVKADAWNTQGPIDPLLLPKAMQPIPSKVLVYRSLLALAALSRPFSEHRARRFKRSAEKRNPYRVIDDPVARDGLTFSNAQPRPLDPESRRRVLVADYRIPRPDVSAGESATFGMIADLRALGFEVTFVPTDMSASSPYGEALEALGVTVVTSESGYLHAADYVRGEGHRFGVFYLIRVDVAEAVLAAARQASPHARIIFHAPDLYHLREMRGAELSGNPAKRAAAEKMRLRETKIMQAADHVVLVSPAELPFLRDIVPEGQISVFPALYSSVIATPKGFTERTHLFFLGGFKHLPNIGAVRWFVDAIWPAIHARLPGVEFHILGAEAPEEIIALGARPGVRYVGYVQDLDAAMERYRLSVAPLLFGAGIKGKLGTAMGAGVPCVSTTIGAEGMGIVDGVHALVRDTAEGFADAVVALHDDQDLWERISAKGQALVDERFGMAANRSSFYRALDRAEALSLDMYVDWIKAAPDCTLPQADPQEPVDVSIIVPVHNQWTLTRDCLVSVERALRGAALRCEVILADDASSDETREAAARFPGLKVVRQETNLGFLRNCNAASSTARGAALVFLNNDTIVLPGWLTEMVRLLEADPRAAIVGSKLLYPDGTIQETGAVLFSDGQAGNLGRGKPRHDPLFSFDREVDYATGASILVRRSFWDEIGGFDTRYAPAYCEDTDLAMTARQRGFSVLCAARSEAVHFEHGTYGEAQAAQPKALAQSNGRKLVEKWSASFAADHMPPGTQPEIAAAHAERHVPLPAAARRAGEALNILYFSPFPSHPDNHGNQATIQAYGRHFRKMGHKVHFALLQSEMYDEASLSAMRAAWDSFTILPNKHPLRSNGETIHFDGWYEQGLGENIRLLCERREIDMVFCSYVFQSKLLDFVPAHILKVIDTHDKMGDRYEMLRQKGQPLEFFSCSPAEEGAYLRRADIVVARRAEEATYFDSVTGRNSAIVIPHIEEPRFLERRFKTLAHVGLVASANRINLAITLEFLRALESARGQDPLPFKVHVAGQVRDMIPSLPKEDQAIFTLPWVELHGFVPDIASFYGQMDVVVSPVTMGTGINVKTVQAMAFGMPLLTTAWGSKGIETGHPRHLHATVETLAADLLTLSADPTDLEALAEVSRARYRRFLNEGLSGFDRLVASCRG